MGIDNVGVSSVRTGRFAADDRNDGPQRRVCRTANLCYDVNVTFLFVSAIDMPRGVQRQTHHASSTDPSTATP